MILDTYSHVAPGLQAAVIESLNEPESPKYKKV